MGKISDTSKYPVVTPVSTDIVLGTDVGSSNATKNFTVGSIAGLATDTTYVAGAGLQLSLNVGTPDEFSTRLFTNGGIRNDQGTGANQLRLDLSQSAIQGTLGVANGGTGLTSVSTLLNANVNYASDGTGTLPVAKGGTNLTSNGGTDGKVMKANGTGFAMESRDGSFRTRTSSTSETITFDYQVYNNLYLSTTGGLQAIEVTGLDVNDAGVIVVSFDGGSCLYPQLAGLDASGSASVYVSRGVNGAYTPNVVGAAIENEKIMLTYRKVNSSVIVVDFADKLVLQPL